MSNITAYIGSRNPNSRTYIYTQKILNNLYHKYNIESQMFSPLNLKLNPSTGCKNCFTQGYCPFEANNQDDGDYIKKTIENSKIFIIATPVHSHNVSVDTKILIDRLSYWLHIFKMIGKHIIIIDTAESNGSGFVQDYLKKTFTLMGGQISHTVSFINSEYDLSDDLINECVEKITDIFYDKIDYQVSNKQEIAYQTLKIILQDYDPNNFEYKYWKNKNLFKAESLEDWFFNYEKNSN
ncbi:flavodoxin family protein [Staphylococcus hominis]|uniref:flavodoxin family protein n=1 Tax=Staphylococcus hominis TaxID=1290 RepID=UPI002879F99B|nr:flavodoxin family protein [Staphylococcus hominis]MDS3918864.1 flavodoxin family protein [Staphylococcus hominis]